MFPLSLLIILLLVFSCNARQILKTCPNDNVCEAAGEIKTLEHLLTSTFKKLEDVKDIELKLEVEGIDFDTLMQLDANDIRDTFKEFGIKSWKTGLIINKFRDIEGSAVQKYQSTESPVVVLSAEQNDYILELTKNKENANENIRRLQQAEQDVIDAADAIESEIENYYEALVKIVLAQKMKTLGELTHVRDEKLRLLRAQGANVTAAFEILLASDRNLSEIINDQKLNIQEKQGAVTKFIKYSQQSLVKHQGHLQGDMPFVTQPNITYIPKTNETFIEFMNDIDEILDGTPDLFLSNIVTMSESKQLLSWFEPQSKRKPFHLLYRASRDGFGANVFHQRCDNKGATLTIVQSSYGNVFGGFTTRSWTSTYGYIFVAECWQE